MTSELGIAEEFPEETGGAVELGIAKEFPEETGGVEDDSREIGSGYAVMVGCGGGWVERRMKIRVGSLYIKEELYGTLDCSSDFESPDLLPDKNNFRIISPLSKLSREK